MNHYPPVPPAPHSVIFLLHTHIFDPGGTPGCATIVTLGFIVQRLGPVIMGFCLSSHHTIQSLRLNSVLDFFDPSLPFISGETRICTPVIISAQSSAVFSSSFLFFLLLLLLPLPFYSILLLPIHFFLFSVYGGFLRQFFCPVVNRRTGGPTDKIVAHAIHRPVLKI